WKTWMHFCAFVRSGQALTTPLRIIPPRRPSPPSLDLHLNRPETDIVRLAVRVIRKEIPAAQLLLDLAVDAGQLAGVADEEDAASGGGGEVGELVSRFSLAEGDVEADAVDRDAASLGVVEGGFPGRRAGVVASIGEEDHRSLALGAAEVVEARDDGVVQ